MYINSYVYCFCCHNYNLLIHWCEEWGDKAVDKNQFPRLKVRMMGSGPSHYFWYEL